MSSSSGPGVVERASKEISRRIHSLGFSKKSKAEQQQQQRGEQQEDKLNGNETDDQNAAKPAPAATTATNSVSRMGTIIKGSVMDKVTHVFNSSSMGNANNKDQSQAAAAASAAAAAPAPADPAAAATGGSINIPKGTFYSRFCLGSSSIIESFISF